MSLQSIVSKLRGPKSFSLSSGGGGGAATSVPAGTPFTGGDPGAIVYLDASGDMQAKILNLSYDELSGAFYVSDGLSNYLTVSPTTGLYQLGDVGAVYNGTAIGINDTARQVGLNNVAAAFLFDGVTGVSSIGDTIGNGNSIVVTVDDTNMSITLAGGDLNFFGGVTHSYATPAYGTTHTFGVGNYHIAFSTGTGATTVDLSGASIGIGRMAVISDLDRISATSNITIDAGVGNTIVTSASAAQTLVLATNGISVSLQKISATQWMLISRNT